MEVTIERLYSEQLIMNPAESLENLVDLLEQTEVAWDDIELLLQIFPGWLKMVRAVRYPVRPIDNRIAWGPMQLEFTQVGALEQERLLRFFRPFAILANQSLLPAERAHMLIDYEIDPLIFCREHQHDALADIAVSAVEVLDALAANGTLLRGHEGALPAENLVLPTFESTSAPGEMLRTSAQKPDEQPSRPGWLSKVLGKRRR